MNNNLNGSPINQIVTLKKTTPYFGSRLEPFSFIREGFSFSNLGYIDVTCKNVSDIDGCVQQILTHQTGPINQTVSDYTTKINNLNKQMIDLSQNILNFDKNQKILLNANPNTNPYYDYIGTVLSSPPTIQDGIIDDNYEMALNENTLHIVGSITLATLLITAIMLASKK